MWSFLRFPGWNLQRSQECRRSWRKNRTSEIQLCSDGVFPGQSGHRSTVGLLSGSELSYHRILVRHNFCNGSKGYWTECNSTRVDETTESTFQYMNQYAYPLNTIGKPEIMKELLERAKTPRVWYWRWGEHQHYNSDLVVELALKMAEELNSAQ